MDHVLDRALADAGHLSAGGLDGIMVENYHDTPFLAGRVEPETVAAMAVAVDRIRSATPLPVGVNILRNDAASAVSLAASTGAAFIRVNVHVGTMFTDQGTLHGDAGSTLRRRAALGAPTAILADVFVKHASPPARAAIDEVARDTWHRGKADGLIVSGPGTGRPTEVDALQAVRAAVPEAPIWIGSGLTPENAAQLLGDGSPDGEPALVHGAIVGSALQVDGRSGSPVDPDRVLRLVEAVRD
jgi:membrane complex biogenesis BtpA family protein